MTSAGIEREVHPRHEPEQLHLAGGALGAKTRRPPLGAFVLLARGHQIPRYGPPPAESLR